MTGRPYTTRVGLDAGRLWAGGAATALVAALVAVVGAVVVQRVLDVKLVRPPFLAPWGNSLESRYAWSAALLALAATALAHVLVVTTPRPGSFFGWIMGLLTTAAVAWPFGLEGSTAGRVGTAVIDLLIGLSIITLLLSVLALTVRPEPVPVRGFR